MEDEVRKKAHRVSKSKVSRKTEGKKEKGKRGHHRKDESIDPKLRNPKAFAFTSAVRAERTFRRTRDIQTKKERVPLVDRTPVDLPPFIIALVGPPKVGKSTLFQNLIKHFTRQTLTDVKGPVTVISGKKRRLTLIECNNDINSMIDIAKVADLVLLLVDASFGFEMEVFEFLNICQVHGFPQIMGVLTHLDVFRNKDHLKKTKKTLKHRFWTEVYPGSKLFYLSGYHPMTNSYPKNEIQNLARFISVMKFRPTVWRTEHAYVVADRLEDMTHPQSIQSNPKVDRSICLYGFVHGTFLKPHMAVHIPGLGDYTPQAVTVLEDPCPLPLKERVLKRSLNEKERMIYAPFSGVGGVVYDQDAVYIDLGGSHSHGGRALGREEDQPPEPALPFIGELRDLKSSLDQKMDSAQLRLFSSSQDCFTSQDLNQPNADEEVDMGSGGKNAVELIRAEDGRMRRKVIFREEQSNLMAEDKEIVDQLKSELEQIKADPSTDHHHLSPTGFESSDEEDKFEPDDGSSEDDKSEDEEEESTQPIPNKKRNSESGANLDEVAQLVTRVKARLSKPTATPDPVKEESDLEDDASGEEDGEDFESSQDEEEESDGGKVDLGESEHEEDEPDIEEGEEDEEELEKEKQRRLDEAKKGFFSRMKVRSLQKTVYEEEEGGGGWGSGVVDFDLANCTAMDADEEVDEEGIQDLFVGGDYAEDAKKLLDEDDKDVFGDFEELDGGEEVGAGEKEGSEGEELDGGPQLNLSRVEKRKAKREEKKRKLKERFDMAYDEGGVDKGFYDDWKTQVEEQTKVNRTFFNENTDDPELLHDLQGLPPGSYVRVELRQIPCEFIANFDAQRTAPLVIGSLDTPNQEALTIVQARVKKHRWHPKILKTRDPIILSVGWRRFQTICLYSVHDHNLRNRMVKYTPEHLHCVANFYGPVTPQGTGILGIAPAGFDGFRITCTGTVLDMDKTTQLVKKLKLIGTPSKIFKKSAFIDGMFTSGLEVTKFTGARIKSVSGVRGVIKRALRSPEGSFRATFEDKILPSDIIFCRTWANVDVPKFFLNLPTHIMDNPRLVKTLGQLKRERDIQALPNLDHLYTPVVREEKKFRPLKIPKRLQEKLPYKDKPKIQAKLNAPKRIAVIKEPEERKMSQMLKLMKSRLGVKEGRERAEKARKAGEREKVMKRLEAKQTYRQKELRKKVFRTLGLMNKGKPDGGEGVAGGRGRAKFNKRRR